MRALPLKIGLLVALVIASWTPSSARAVIESGQGPVLRSIGPIMFNLEGILFAADNEAGTIYALDIGGQRTGAAVGTAPVDGLDAKIAAALGTAATEIAVTDLAVDPRTRTTYVSVMRGQGSTANPALVRVDGAGDIQVIDFARLKFSKVDLPNAPDANPGARNNPRSVTVTDMAYTVDGKLIVAGLSNEEFSSKLRVIPYPFKTVDRGASVEIFHGNHGQVETRSPVYTFVERSFNGESTIIAGYLCTPLVKFPLASLKAGEKVRGVTVAELGAGNRPIDMIVYRAGGGRGGGGDTPPQEYLLMTNNSRGVMKIPVASVMDAPGITEKVTTETGGVAFEKVASMTGIEQLELLDRQNAVVIARVDGGLKLNTVPLP